MHRTCMHAPAVSFGLLFVLTLIRIGMIQQLTPPETTPECNNINLPTDADPQFWDHLSPPTLQSCLQCYNWSKDPDDR